MALELKAARRGFTVIEVIVAVVLLGGVALTIGAATARLLASTTRDAQALTALDLVNDRLANVLANPTYTDLQSRFEESDTPVPLFPGMVRTTVVQRQVQNHGGGRQSDMTMITVSVTGPGLTAAVVRSTTVAAP
jgi:prepilin-type N-terminal cleavage/methylation domain-containing protein